MNDSNFQIFTVGKNVIVSCCFRHLILCEFKIVWFYHLSEKCKLAHRREFLKLKFRALALCHSICRGADIRNETSALETIYGGQFTSSTQLIKPNYLVILPLRRSTTVFTKNYAFRSFFFHFRCLLFSNCFIKPFLVS